jgi:hypothetical protein
MFASLNLMQELLISASIARAEPPAALPAASSIDRMMRPKRPPLRTTRPPSDLTTAATQSAHAKPAPARSYLTSPEKVSKPEFTGPKTTHTGKNGLLGRLPGKSVNDKSTVIYNEYITVTSIPLEAYEYVVNGKPAIDWVMERQAVTTDKDSGITNDANLWATETMNNPRYPLELLQRVITVSLETMKIVSKLPKLEID